MEDRSRCNNLRINGIQEDEKETSEVLEQKINLLIKEDLEINKNITIERECTGVEQRNIEMVT